MTNDETLALGRDINAFFRDQRTSGAGTFDPPADLAENATPVQTAAHESASAGYTAHLLAKPASGLNKAEIAYLTKNITKFLRS